MPKRLTKTEQAARDDHFREHPNCWMCLFLGRKQEDRTTLHHLAGRGRYHECRENYVALCSFHHDALQSRNDAELVCLVLKRAFDPEHYSPETICRLRGRALTCWQDSDVETCRRVMVILRECLK